MPSRASGRIATVEPPETARDHHTDKQVAYTGGDDVISGAQIEVSDTGDEKVGDYEVRKSQSTFTVEDERPLPGPRSGRGCTPALSRCS